ncbi:MAG: Crp/Fnr family transcriptional regulator [Helicobacteraceae bacterium]|jgi:CRP/FNR family transcriptional regulator|nr:Crp/Fnr family transcriptional regulator [Helicobacteraceae bacterium]
MSDIEAVKASGLFSSLDEADKSRLFQVLKTKQLQDGEILFYENATIDRVYFLVSGSVKSYKVNRFHNEIFLFRQNTAGLITLYTPFSFKSLSQFFSNLESIGTSLVASIERDQVDNLCVSAPNIGKLFFQMFADRLLILQNIITRDMVYDSIAKVAYTIDKKPEEFKTYKKQEVAYMLNIQPETLSRILGRLKSEKVVVEEKRGDFTVKNRAALKGYYEL